MLIALVFILVIVAIAATGYLSATSGEIGPMIEDGSDECFDCEKNIICMYCWGLIEQHCSCHYRQSRQCQCIEPQRYGGVGK